MDLPDQRTRYNFLVTGRIVLFGGVRIERGSGEVSRPPTQKAAQLLGYLALPPRRTHSRESLATLLWPDAPPEAARHSLRQALSSLRKLLGDDALTLDGRERVGLAESVSTDLDDFLRRVAAGDREGALALAVAPLFEGVYEDWALAERERCDALLARLSLPRIFELPAPLTRFFGRESELASLATSLDDPQVRLVTLTGPGGTGKTRLALEAAHVAARFEQTIFVGLEAVTEPSRLLESVVEQVGRALERTPEPGRDPLTTLRLWCERPTLLLWDNFEGLCTPGGIERTKQTLERCPNLTLLLTSRRALGLRGERELPLAPLPTPAELPNMPLADVPSVRLFLDRARAVRPNLTLTPAIAALCDALEGIPLALELAASRSRALTPAQLRERLTDRFDLLVGSDTGAPERHRTLWNAIDGSVRLLDPAARAGFHQLALFRGGATVEAAEALGVPLDALERCLQAALLQSVETDLGLRFSMRETLREYALATGESAARADGQDRHAAWFLELATRCDARLRGPEQAEALARLDAEWENLRLARQTLRERNNRAGLLALAAAVALYLVRRARLTEGIEWLTEALETEGDPALSAKLCDALGALYVARSEFPSAEDVLRQGLALRQSTGDALGMARSRLNLGTLLLDRGDPLAARGELEAGLAQARAAGQEPFVAAALGNLGVAAMQLRDWDGARAFLLENLRLRQRSGDASGEALARLNLAAVALRAGDADEAAALYREAQRQLAALGDRRHLALASEGLGEALAQTGEFDEAARWLGAAQSELDRLGAIRTPDNATDFDRALGLVRHNLGPTYRTRFHEGETSGLDALLHADQSRPLTIS